MFPALLFYIYIYIIIYIRGCFGVAPSLLYFYLLFLYFFSYSLLYYLLLLHLRFYLASISLRFRFIQKKNHPVAWGGSMV